MKKYIQVSSGRPLTATEAQKHDYTQELAHAEQFSSLQEQIEY